MTPAPSSDDRIGGRGSFAAMEQVRALYTVFLGLLLATGIAVGIAAFYAAPNPPVQQVQPEPIDKQGQVDPAAVREQEAQYRRYEARSEAYNRNVSIVAVGFAILLLATSMATLKQIPVIANGVMLGGVFTLVYAIVRSFGSDDQKFMFVIVLIGIVVTLALGYLRLIRPAEQQ